MHEPKTFLVTGASRGIGLLTARSLAGSGHFVFAGIRNVAGRNAGIKDDLSAWADDHGFGLEPVEMDVTDEGSVDSAVSRPIRTTVGDDMGLVRINRHTAPVQSDLVRALGNV